MNLIDSIKKNKIQIFDKNNAYRRYITFVLEYVKKSNYMKVLIRIFMMNTMIEYITRYSQIKLYKIDDKNTEKELFYIILFVTIRLINNLYEGYKFRMDKKNEREIETIFEKEVFIKKSKIPFSMRQKIDMTKMDNLKRDVISDLNNMINDTFDKMIKIIINYGMSIYVFYENKMLTQFILMSIVLYRILKKKIYPLYKKNAKNRERDNEHINKMYNEMNLLEFGFLPFIENERLFDKIREKEEEINNFYMKIEESLKDKNKILNNISEIFTLIIFMNNYMKGVRNYYIIITTITSLFDVCKDTLRSISDIEEVINKYIEFNKFFKDIPNDDNLIYAEKIDFPLEIDIDIDLNSEKQINGKIKIDKKSKIFITGKSGAGKSTLAKKIVGYDYYDLNKEIYRKCIYYLTQDFNETWRNSDYRWKDIFSNMRTMDEVSCYLMNFAFPINKLKGKSIEDEIPILSGGEKKRLQYAYLMNKYIEDRHKIIILDEPHKDLDETTALMMIKGIEKLYSSKSIIIIKHEKPLNEEFKEWKEWKIDESGKIECIN